MDASTQRQPAPTSDDTLWYKDAVIYQLHVKAFYDANDDGIGDFAGLTRRLDYLQELGVTTIWLLPFYPSPLRDDGYDIADYRGVNPAYGTLREFRTFVRECHHRGLRVITELVINHTSDQHPWFQRARRAKPGSVWRNFYVWSDTDQRYQDTRIIFLDTERSNWAWDEEARAFYWHRFYTHQPDLNFDNPHVLKEITRVLRYWLEMGVDGLRLDAVPYLVEREGTNNENLPETHAVLKKIRAEVDAKFPGCMLLAEANQWPEDVLPYFSDGDECHMAFHFPLMPRIYMAIAREDRHPVTDILRQTPDIPDNCQWAIFLRNHDELTLEMVTERERDYLWNFYAGDRRMRINLGIRRRLAPLMGNDRRKIELMNGLLLSLPGTPVLYYGDEIGMGDNVFLGDRDGVRTPMQWSPDRNGGFSRADPPRLFLPPIMDPVYGFGAINVEAQVRSPASLLNWNRRVIAMRQGHQAFGRGSMTLLYPGNRKVLAYLREYADEVILCVFNLSRAAQAVELDLSRFKGRVPVEIFGGNPFPPIGDLYYLLTLPAYGFHWFVLATETAVPRWHVDAPEMAPEFLTLVARNRLADILKWPGRGMLEREIIPSFLVKQRWFSGKHDHIASVRLCAAAPFAEEQLLAEIEVLLHSGTSERYFLPMSLAREADEGTGWPLLPFALARVRRGQRLWSLLDASALDEFPRSLIEAMRSNLRFAANGDGHFVFAATDRLAAIEITPDTEIRRLGVEQSNTSIRVGDAMMLKLYRKLQAGAHAEVQMNRFLTAHGFANAPPLLGTVERVGVDGVVTVLAVAQGFVINQGDGWIQTVEHLQRRLEEVALAPETDTPESRPHDFHAELLKLLGRRTAELHRVLATPNDDPAFEPEPTSAQDIASWTECARQQAGQAFDALEAVRSDLTGEALQPVEALIARRRECLDLIEKLAANGLDAAKTRIHGDYHLGQTLLADDDWVIVDFEGEPALPLVQRLGKFSPLRDVAGMLRSFDYATAVALQHLTQTNAPVGENVQAFACAWRDSARDAFLDGYIDSIAGTASYPTNETDARRWLALFTLEKACYEIVYEARNRPDWLPIPVHGTKDLLDANLV